MAPGQRNKNFWDNLKTLLPNIKYFEFTGGEPFLIEQHFELLRYAVENDYAKNIEIHYNTNGTVFPELQSYGIILNMLK
jgi:organic radical activating enzyme